METAPEAPSSMTVKVLKSGPWGKADIFLVAQAGRTAILKDFSLKAWPVRWVGRWQLRRERRALECLKGLPGIPAEQPPAACCGLYMSPVAGEPITRWRRRRREEIIPMMERLDRLVDRIHERGVAHLDLRKRDNILVSNDGVPSIIDFNASVCFRVDSLAARVMFPVLRRVDRSAVLKWKSLLAPDTLTESERRRHRRMSLLRRFWIFN